MQEQEARQEILKSDAPALPVLPAPKVRRERADTQETREPAWSVLPAQWDLPDPWALKA
jgi:hypothetical protein